MPYDPAYAVGEILGQPSALTPDLSPIEKERVCPFTSKKCIKSKQPICSFWEWSGSEGAGYSQKLVATCPKRFFQTDFLSNIVEHCWPEEHPKEIKVLSEVTLTEFGRLDFVIVGLNEDGEIHNFLPVEVQAVDITTPKPLRNAYKALYDGVRLNAKPGSGGNWDNVYKRYVTQLVRKGFVSQSWGTKIIAVVQDEFFNYMFNKYPFMFADNNKSTEANINFITYKFTPRKLIKSGNYKLKLESIVGTNHASLQGAHLYKSAPTRSDFISELTRRLSERQTKREKYVSGGGSLGKSISKYDVLGSKSD